MMTRMVMVMMMMTMAMMSVSLQLRKWDKTQNACLFPLLTLMKIIEMFP